MDVVLAGIEGCFVELFDIEEEYERCPAGTEKISSSCSIGGSQCS